MQPVGSWEEWDLWKLGLRAAQWGVAPGSGSRGGGNVPEATDMSSGPRDDERRAYDGENLVSNEEAPCGMRISAMERRPRFGVELGRALSGRA
ncbi:hypothetical protein NL676_025819 [Syzygium grande]|nr:hypothetical protein NL676_025819 [Syzygium grande]